MPLTEEQAERIIRAYFDEAAGVKLEDDGEWLFDHDSNWGFSPRELARALVAAKADMLERKMK